MNSQNAHYSQENIEILERLVYLLHEDFYTLISEASSNISNKEIQVFSILKTEEIQFETKKKEIATLMMDIYRRNALDILYQMTDYLMGKQQYILSTFRSSTDQPWLSTVYSVCWASLHISSTPLSNYSSKMLAMGLAQSKLSIIDHSPHVNSSLRYYLTPKFPSDSELEDFLGYYLKKVGGKDYEEISKSEFGNSKMELVRNSMRFPKESKDQSESDKETLKKLLAMNESRMDSMQPIKIRAEESVFNDDLKSSISSKIKTLGTVLNSQTKVNENNYFQDFKPSTLSVNKNDDLLDMKESHSIYPELPALDVTELKTVYEDDEIIIFLKRK